MPETHFLRDKLSLDDPEEWVLKPLFSFGGLGVVVSPTPDRRGGPGPLHFATAHRVAAPMETLYGATKCEIRMMYLWLDEEPQVVNIIVRTGRGEQMGVDFHKGLQ